jgi:glutamate-1-semialdehyde 2,1-aminomutase
VAREGNVGPPVDVAATTRAVEFNDVDALEAALAQEDVAVVIAEPAMTNMGIVLPDDGYHAALRELTRRHGTLLIIDETHTFSAGPGGCTRAWDLEPEMVVIGKAIGSGVPCGALGLDEDLAERLLADRDADIEDTGGVGGTLAGNALSMAAVRATLEHVLTDDVWERTVPLAGRFADGAADPLLERFLHLHALNRGVLITPFHNMALMGPDTTAEDVDRHTAHFDEAAAQVAGSG